MVLVIDPQIAGISGDMMLCSLVDLGADSTRITDGVKSCCRFLEGSAIRNIDFKNTDRGGIKSVELILETDHDAKERTGSEIRRAITLSVEDLGLSDDAVTFAKSCIDALVCSESRIHGVPAESVHLHEASGLDTLVDIVGVAIALDDLGLFGEHISCMPVAVGGGSVKFSHGTMSNPASAVLEILRDTGLHIQGNSAGVELTTPTGACILKGLAATAAEYYPRMQIHSIGYGAGQREIDLFPNVLKIVRGDTDRGLDADSVVVLETNVDDVSGEVLGGMVEKITAAGARDVSIYPGITKKNRPTCLVRVICDAGSANQITDMLVSETGTLGVRIARSDRLVVPRTCETAKIGIKGRLFDVRYKASIFRGRTRIKVEFDDLRSIAAALDMPLWDAEYLIRRGIEEIPDRNARD